MASGTSVTGAAGRGVDSDEAVDVVRRRLVLFLGVIWVLSAISVVAANVAGVYQLGRSWADEVAHPGNRAQVATLVVLGLIWLVCRLTRPSRRILQLIDALSIEVLCVSGAAMTYFAPMASEPGLDIGAPLSPGLPVAVLTNLAVLTMRAALVPSTPRRTLIINILGTIPVLVVAYLVQHRHPSPETVSFASGTVIISVLILPIPTIISAVVYRLRLQVRRAMHIGQYTLERKIGEGGMGTVYRARHAFLRRATAIKLLPPDRAGAQSLARFEREVQHTSRLSHPNTVAIFDFGHTADGIFYYAMEYLDGLSLEELVEHDGPQPLGRVVHILRQTCGALAEAHAADLVHRDIKPANLHLCTRGGLADHVKVLDFGLVKDTAAAADSPLSAVSHILGTPSYMAPEMIVRPDAIDGRADLYAVGAVAYFLLTGTPPFEAATVVEVCSKHLHLAPDPPSSRLGRLLPPALDALVLRCLAKNRDDRPTDATALARELAACPGVPAWTEEDASRWWRDRSGAVLARLSRGDLSFASEKTVAVDLDDRGRA